MKSKMRESDIIFRFRHCLAFITIVVFLLIYGTVAECAESEVGNGGAYTVDPDFYSSLGIEEGSTPNLDISSMQIAYESSGGVWSNLYTTSMVHDNTGRFVDAPYGYKLPTSITVSNTTVNFPSTAYYFSGYAWNSASSQQFFYNFRASGSGHFAIVNQYGVSTQRPIVISDQPFVVGYTRYMAYFGTINVVGLVNVDTLSENGFYVYDAGGVLGCGLTNIPIYCPSSDGKSGYTNYSSTSTDFSFSGDNFNFNNLLANDIVIDPNPPQENPDEVQPFSSLGLNFVFGSVDPEFISASDDSGIFAEYNFHLNSYMLTHPDEFTFHMEYDVIATTVIGDGKFEYNRSITVSDILKNNDQTFAHNMRWYDFEDANDYNLGQLLNRIYTNAGNQSSSYTDGAVISYGAGRAGSTRTFGKMTSGVRNLYDNDISSMKFYYTCYFVWHGEPETTSGKLKGWKDLKSANNNTTQNDISNNYYPPSSDVASQYPSNSGGSGGNTTNNGGVFNDGDVIIYDNDGLWTPYTLDQVSYANVKDMFDDIREFIDSTSDNSFWGVISRTFSYIPAKIWQYITITVAVICGFAVVRYVLRR